jgi:hypothetical protein
MKAKKALSLVLVGIFAFATVAGAADDYNFSSHTNCKICPKCDIGNVPCPTTTTIPGPQGTSTVVTEEASPFDFDGRAYIDGGFGSYGYCTGFNYSDDPLRNCKYTFDVCSCDAACEITMGEAMGLQMYIKTPGVYWASYDSTTMNSIHFDIYEQVTGTNPTTSICAANTNGPLVTTMESVPYYESESGERISGEVSVDKMDFVHAVVDGVEQDYTGNEVRAFNQIKYYRGYNHNPDDKTDFEDCPVAGDPSYCINNKGKYVSVPDPTMEGTPLAGSLKGAIPVVNRVNILQSEYAGDYRITKTDPKGRCKLWIDIPPMRIDPTIAKEGDIVEIAVRLIFNREVEGLCPECDPPDVCECIVQVAVVCCGDSGVDDSGQYCMYFPYVVEGIELSSGWAAGIAVTSRAETMPADAYCELTLTDMAGNVATYKKTGVQKIWTFMVDSELANFTGSTLVPGAASLTVQSNYSMDGYSFLTDGNFGAGTLARGCGTGKCAP